MGWTEEIRRFFGAKLFRLSFPLTPVIDVVIRRESKA